MVVNVTKLKNYQKLAQAFITNVNEFYKSLYLDFEEKYIYVFSDHVQARIPFDYEGEALENTYIDGKMFFNVMSLSDENLVFEDDKFKLNKDSFKIPLFRDESDFKKDFSSFDTKWDIKFNANFFSLLKKTKNIIPLNDERKKSVWGVFLRDNNFVVSDKLRFIDVKLYNECEDIDISHDLLKILYLCVGNETIDIYENESSYKVIIDDSVEFLVSKTINLELPDIRSEGFKNLYKTEDYFEVDKDSFVAGLKVLEPFIVESSSEALIVELKENNLVFKIDDSAKSIFTEKEVLTKLISKGIQNTAFKMSYTFLKDLENLLRCDTFKIYFSDAKDEDEKPLTKTINVVDPDEEALNDEMVKQISHIVLVKIPM